MRERLISVFGVFLIVLPIFVANLNGVQMTYSVFTISCVVLGIILAVLGMYLEFKKRKEDR